MGQQQASQIEKAYLMQMFEEGGTCKKIEAELNWSAVNHDSSQEIQLYHKLPGNKELLHFLIELSKHKQAIHITTLDS